MNHDDPNLTAYALGELPPEEVEALENLLRGDPAAQAEVEEIRALSGRLKGELAGEGPLELSEERRVALLRANVEAFAKPKRRPVWISLALAASVAVVLGGAWLIHANRPQLMVARTGRTPALPAAMPEGGLATAEPEPAPAPLSGGTLAANSEAKALEPAASAPESINSLRPTTVAALPPPPAAPAPLLAQTDSGSLGSAGALKRAETVTEKAAAKSAETLAFNDDAKNRVVIATPDFATAPASPAAEAPVVSSVASHASVPPSSKQLLASGAPLPVPGGTAAQAKKDTFSGSVDKVAAAGGSAAQPAERNALLGNWMTNPVDTRASKDSPIMQRGQAGVPSTAPVAAKVQLASQFQGSGMPMRSQLEAVESSKVIGFNDYERERDLYGNYEESRRSRDADASRYEPYGKAEVSKDEKYAPIVENDFIAVRDQPRSTFSIDVDTASYTNVRRFLQNGQRPPRDAVKLEELLNYFHYDYPAAPKDLPCSVNLESADCPWAPEHSLVRIGLKAQAIAAAKRPIANLVFLLDVSGSMSPENRLPLAIQSLRLLTDQLGPEDRVSIVYYANSSGIALEPTSDKTKVREALAQLHADGGTNGGAGIQTAYELAKENFQAGQVNRVILCTDGDFNVGVTSRQELMEMIAEKARSGVFLTVLGFGYGNLKDATLEKLADRGNGNYAYIDNLTEGRRVLVEQLGGTLINVAKDVKVQIEFNPAQVSAYRLLGYEKRNLRTEDFKNDKVDAGDLGSGQTVTALYEIIPPGAPSEPAGEGLKYQPVAAATPKPAPAAEAEGASKEMLTLQLRWKAPEGEQSSVHEFPYTPSGGKWQSSSTDFRWAAAVASFGMLLRDSPHAGNASWGSTRELARGAKGEDANGYRQEFLSLIDQAEAASR